MASDERIPSIRSTGIVVLLFADGTRSPRLRARKEADRKSLQAWRGVRAFLFVLWCADNHEPFDRLPITRAVLNPQEINKFASRLR